MPKQIKKPRPLTYKQRAFIKHIIDNPKDSATEAAAQTYNLSNRDVARSVAAENLAKPSIVSALAAHNQLVEQTIIKGIDDYKDSEKIQERTLAIDTAKWVHDKIHGKAVQRTEANSTSLIAHISNKPYKV